MKPGGNKVRVCVTAISECETIQPRWSEARPSSSYEETLNAIPFADGV